jgi:hypothetical protein
MIILMNHMVRQISIITNKVIFGVQYCRFIITLTFLNFSTRVRYKPTKRNQTARIVLIGWN